MPSGWSSGFTKPAEGVYVWVSVAVAVGGAMMVAECGKGGRVVGWVFDGTGDGRDVCGGCS